MNMPNLLIDIQPLSSRRSRNPVLRRTRPIITSQRGALPPRGFLLADDRLASHTVEDVATLGGEAFEVCRYVAGREVGC